MSVLKYFKNTPRSPPLGRQALSVFFFFKFAMRCEHGKCNNFGFMQEQKALPSALIKVSCTTLSLRIPRPLLSLHMPNSILHMSNSILNHN